MASLIGSKSRQISSPSPFASSSTAFLSRSLSTKHEAMCGKYACSSSEASVRFQIDGRPASPGRSISVQKNRERNANAVLWNKKKWCMCSPFTHPGSFRCSLHKKNWRQSVNVVNRSGEFPNGSLNFRRSAMANSIVRIGGVEGADLVKRALAALVRPSSHQVRQRSAFQPRPSRLSVMSKAEEEKEEE
ncbi:uncharacterized protein LOC111479564 [Cucurbita maxima]|uniref:Uncharacterized protein LOC111479564 n=1 Tax=Cucurbita maxima TaxID=3661 RepID=A0A6J1IQC9_CUCMA|nr:uncharacterized protein LOC111479564 [Cucurbita maxima]